MEFLKLFRKRSFLSESVYVLLNILLAVAVLVLVRTLETPLPAFLLVILSKWRVLAVRPRYWWSNIQANLVDVIVGLGVVALMFEANGNAAYGFMIQIAITVLYLAWLIYLKPKSSERAIVAQSGISLFVGVTALFTISFAWPVSAVTVAMATIGYITARHILSQNREDELQLLSTVWAFILALIGWVSYHWTIAYNVPVIGFMIPQVAVITICFGFVAYTVYGSFKTHETVRPVDVVLPILFAISIVTVLLVFFNRVSAGIV